MMCSCYNVDVLLAIQSSTDILLYKNYALSVHIPLQPDICLQMSSLTISSDGSSTDRSPQSAPPILPANNKEEKSAHIGSSDDESTPTRSAAVHVVSQTAVIEVSVGQ